MSDFDYKIEKELLPRINGILNIKILELGVQKGRSTIKFLNYVKKIMVNYFLLILMTAHQYQMI